MTNHRNHHASIFDRCNEVLDQEVILCRGIDCYLSAINRNNRAELFVCEIKQIAKITTIKVALNDFVVRSFYFLKQKRIKFEGL